MTSPELIYKHKDFLIINKPAGLLVHRAVFNKVVEKEEKTLVDWLVKNYPELKKIGEDTVNRPGIVHRLDRETSGIILVPRTQEAFEYFKKLFQKHLINKTYLALVFGKAENKKGIINKPIGLKSGTTRHTVRPSKMMKEAITEYEVVKYLHIKGEDLTLIKASPKTGRTHQIRVHLASIRLPIVGDKMYGRKRNPFPEIKRQFLHAQTIEFKWKKSTCFKFEADLPKEITAFLKLAQ
ncbi:RNA pseudouridine synthase [Patescibacteria group bacterium]|nr:RNA pseudouridine synthase [Patescibacteria group bacterium]